MDHIRRVVLGLGSNVGDRVKNITAAVDELRHDREVHVLKLSPLYETAAEGPLQADFVNGAVLVLTSLPAGDLLTRALAVETKLGRVRSETPKGPRTIDIDLLWIEGETVRDDGLTVPHPSLVERSFALRPLLDLAPDATNEAGKPFRDFAAASVELRRLD